MQRQRRNAFRRNARPEPTRRHDRRRFGDTCAREPVVFLFAPVLTADAVVERSDACFFSFLSRPDAFDETAPPATAEPIKKPNLPTDLNVPFFRFDFRPWTLRSQNVTGRASKALLHSTNGTRREIKLMFSISNSNIDVFSTLKTDYKRFSHFFFCIAPIRFVFRSIRKYARESEVCPLWFFYIQ